MEPEKEKGITDEDMAKFYREIAIILEPIPEIPSLPIYEAKACGKPTLTPHKEDDTQ